MAKTGLSSKLLVPQRIGFGVLAFLLIVMSEISALAMDMFSPALPTMVQQFGITTSEGSFAITSFFLFYAVGMLIFGTFSDKFGRKLALIITMGGFILGSALCALAVNFPMLIAFRVIQALGGGGAAAVGMALLKDVFTDEPREKFLLFMAIIQVIGPIAAPIIGGLVMTFTTWHAVFWILAGVGVVCFALIVLYNESLPKEERLKESALMSYKRMGVVLKDRAFTLFLILTILPAFAFGAYLAVGSFIYIDYFGTSEAVFGIWFAVTAGISMGGPALYTLLLKKFTRKQLVTIILAAPALGAVLELLFGHVNEALFTFCFAPVTLASAAMRPSMSAILLQQNEKDAGSASGIILFAGTIAGSIGMAIAGMFAFDFIFGLIILTVVTTALSLVMWAFFCRSDLKLRAFELEKEAKEQGEQA